MGLEAQEDAASSRAVSAAGTSPGILQWGPFWDPTLNSTQFAWSYTITKTQPDFSPVLSPLGPGSRTRAGWVNYSVLSSRENS